MRVAISFFQKFAYPGFGSCLSLSTRVREIGWCWYIMRSYLWPRSLFWTLQDVTAFVLSCAYGQTRDTVAIPVTLLSIWIFPRVPGPGCWIDDWVSSAYGYWGILTPYNGSWESLGVSWRFAYIGGHELDLIFALEQLSYDLTDMEDITITPLS